MIGLDFLNALNANGVDLPVRVYLGDSVPANTYRPNALSFCNIAIDDDEDVTPEQISGLCGKYVYLLHGEPTQRVRDMTKVLVSVEPMMLVVAAGDVMTSWKNGRGWL